MKKNIHQDVIISLILILIALFFLIFSFSFPNNIGTFPRIISILMLCMASITLAKGVKISHSNQKSNSANSESGFSLAEKKYPLIAIVYLLVYIVSIKYIGFFVSTFIFLILFMKFFRIKNHRNILLVSLGVNLFIYGLFVNLLKIKLPTGILF